MQLFAPPWTPLFKTSHPQQRQEVVTVFSYAPRENKHTYVMCVNTPLPGERPFVYSRLTRKTGVSTVDSFVHVDLVYVLGTCCTRKETSDGVHARCSWAVTRVNTLLHLCFQFPPSEPTEFPQPPHHEVRRAVCLLCVLGISRGICTLSHKR